MSTRDKVIAVLGGLGLFILLQGRLAAAAVRKRTLTISSGPGGSTSPSPGVYNYDEGSRVSVNAQPNSGYQLAFWMLDGSVYGRTNSVTVTMDKDHRLLASFLPLAPTGAPAPAPAPPPAPPPPTLAPIPAEVDVSIGQAPTRGLVIGVVPQGFVEYVTAIDAPSFPSQGSPGEHWISPVTGVGYTFTQTMRNAYAGDTAMVWKWLMYGTNDPTLFPETFRTWALAHPGTLTVEIYQMPPLTIYPKPPPTLQSSKQYAVVLGSLVTYTMKGNLDHWEIAEWRPDVIIVGPSTQNPVSATFDIMQTWFKAYFKP